MRVGRIALGLGILVAASAAVWALSCTVKLDYTPDDTDFRVVVRGLPPQAKKMRLEIYDLGLLRNSRTYVKEVCEDRGEAGYICNPEEAETAGGLVRDYIVRNHNSDRLFPDTKIEVPVRQGNTEQSIWVITDNIGDLFLHLVVFTNDNLPYMHACACRKGALKVNRGQVIPMPGDLYDNNPELYHGICKTFGLEDYNCFSCEPDYTDLFTNLPCQLAGAADGDEETDLEGETIPSETEPDTDAVADGEVRPEEDQDQPDAQDEEAELPVGKHFRIEAEDTVKVEQCDPSDKVVVTELDPNPLPFYGQVVLLGETYADASELSEGGKLVFEFYVDYPGVYVLKGYFAKACFYGQAKAYIDDQELSGAPYDIDFYEPAPDMQPCNELVANPFVRNTQLETIGEQVFLTTGTHVLKFEVTGKRGIAKGFGMGIDRIEFIPVRD